MSSEKRLKAGEEGFWACWFAKLLFTLISVKVWGLIACTLVSTWLLLIHNQHQPVVVGNTVVEYGINGAQWVTFNTTIWALIFGMKEIFRISEQRDSTDRAGLKAELENRVTLAGMKKQRNTEASSTEIETVGVDPDMI